MAIKKPCYNCSGTGTVTKPPDGEGGGLPPYQCPVCTGDGELTWGEVEDIDNILDKCNDIFEKCVEIKEVVDGL